MGYRVTVRLVIGGISAALVVIAAAITLAITYTVSLGTVDQIGSNYAAALAQTARVQTENFFYGPVLDCYTVQRYMKQPYFFDNPSPDDQPSDAFKLFQMQYALHSGSNFTYAATGIAFADQSSIISFNTAVDMVSFIVRFANNYPNGNMTMILYAVNSTSGLLAQNVTQAVFGDATPDPNVPSRSSAYNYAVTVMVGTAGFWFETLMFSPFGQAEFVLPALIPLYNSSDDFLGLLTVTYPIMNIREFLLSVAQTAGSEAFALDSQSYIYAGSTEAPTYYTFLTASAGYVVAPGCASSLTTGTGVGNDYVIGCRYAASAFAAFPPLQNLANSNPSFLTATGTNIVTFNSGGDTYFVASADVANPFMYWKMNIVLFLPQAAIIGDIVQGRNIAIGVTAGVCVAAALIGVFLVYFILKPLSQVSSKMVHMARLRDTENEETVSPLAEIRDLQRAYSNMNTAIRSFTRYVPRDVVKLLMRNGQLCSISMLPQQCTMMFVDIASFTTICERVPADVLSGLVSNYFERASRIIMLHDGIIDKYIGDCIMAVWGAPFPTSNQEVKATLAGKLVDRETIVEPLAPQWDEVGEQLRVRVGLSSGSVLAGNMGSEDRMSYTVIGDAVNLAARLESMNKQFGTRVMVSEATAAPLENIFVLRLLMPIAVVGKEEPVNVYEVMGLREKIDPEEYERLESIDAKEAEDGTGTDSATNTGAASRYSTHEFVRTNRGTAQMLRDAQAQTNTTAAPIACTEEEALFARRHTAAVVSYTRRAFQKALEQIETNRASAPAYLVADADEAQSGWADVRPHRTCNASKSIKIIEDLCKRYFISCPADFDGVYHALEK